MEQINSEYWKQGYLLAYENSKRLNKVANLAADAGEYCTGCSINILAAEEAVKSAMLFTKYSVPEQLFEIEDKEFKKIFTDHITKLEHLKMIAMINMVSVKQWEQSYEHGKTTLQLLEQLPEAIQKEFKEKFSILFKMPEWIEKLKRNSLVLDKILKWWDSSKVDKNTGFYVGQGSNGTWDDPKNFTKEKFDDSETYTTGIIEHIEILKEFDEMSKKLDLNPYNK